MIKCNAIIRTLADLEEFCAHVSSTLKDALNKNPEFASPIEIWMDEHKGALATSRELYWDKADVEDLLDMEEADRQQREDDVR